MTPSQLTLALIALVVLVASLGLCRIWRRYISRDRDTRRFILVSTGMFALATLVLQLPVVGAFSQVFPLRQEWTFVISNLVLTPVNLVQAVVPLLIAFWVVWRLKPLKTNEYRDYNNASATHTVEDTVRRVFNSDDFASALRTSLPIGQKDKQYGLDYIPFMLDALRAKRRRFDRRANIFFIVTIGVGLIFAGIVVIFGYTLVNERAVGLPRDVAQLESIAADLKVSLSTVEQSALADAPLNELIKAANNELMLFSVNSKTKPVVEEARNALSLINDVTDIDRTVSKLDFLLTTVDVKEPGAQQLSLVLRSTRNKLMDLAESNRGLWEKVNKVSTNLDGAIKKVTDFDDKDQNRVAELLKRLSIGIVVVSFFFGILRYVANQFRANWQQAVRAEEEDLWLRRFYVGMKSAGSSHADRSAVIGALVKGIPEVPSANNKDGEQAEKINLEFLKELLGAISKKI